MSHFIYHYRIIRYHGYLTCYQYSLAKSTVTIVISFTTCDYVLQFRYSLDGGRIKAPFWKYRTRSRESSVFAGWYDTDTPRPRVPSGAMKQSGSSPPKLATYTGIEVYIKGWATRPPWFSLWFRGSKAGASGFKGTDIALTWFSFIWDGTWGQIKQNWN